MGRSPELEITFVANATLGFPTTPLWRPHFEIATPMAGSWMIGNWLLVPLLEILTLRWMMAGTEVGVTPARMTTETLLLTYLTYLGWTTTTELWMANITNWKTLLVGLLYDGMEETGGGSEKVASLAAEDTV